MIGKTAKARSYANIALIKYWGKDDEVRMVPSTSSISLTLKELYTDTVLELITAEESIRLRGVEGDVFYINDILQNDKQHDKITKILNIFRNGEADKNKGSEEYSSKENERNKIRSYYVKIKSYNSMPTAAGLSSSSSGISALIKACNDLYDTQLTTEELAQVSKYGSGSSSRSMFGPVTAWNRKTGNIYPIKTNLKMAMIILVLKDEQKDISSRDGMKICKETSYKFEEWVEKSKLDYIEMKNYLSIGDFDKVGELAERNALDMHELTVTSNPPFSYLTEESIKAMKYIHRLRKDGYKCYFTMDAGPNVKVICIEEDLEKLNDIFSKKYKTIPSKTITLY